MSSISRNTQNQIDAYIAAGWTIQTCSPSGKRASTHDAVRLRSTRYAASQRFPSETWAVRPKLHAVPFHSTGGQSLQPADAVWTEDDFFANAAEIMELAGRNPREITVWGGFAESRYRLADIVQYREFAHELGYHGTAHNLATCAVQARLEGLK